jgi:dimethylargininase
MSGNTYTQALVRPPGASYANAIASVPQRIDADLARQQHSEYIAALATAGISVRVLERQEGLPDSCFMQDPAMIVAKHAILNRMAVPSRFGETELVAEVLRQEFETERIVAPGTLEGGDVLIMGSRLLVGETERTNAAGIQQLRELVEPLGVSVAAVPVSNALHLLTVATYVGENTIVVQEEFKDNSQLKEFRQIVAPRGEDYAANTLGIGNFVIMPAGYPRTQERLRAEGFEVLAVPMSEFYKADGGVSCLSLIW